MSGFNDGYDDRRFRRNAAVSNFLERRSGLIALIIIVLIAVGAIYTTGFVRVPSGYRGVLLTWGKVEDRVLGEGLNFIIPFIQEAELVNVQVQKVESTESAATNDLQEVSTTVAVNFRVDPNYANEVYKELRQDYVSRVITPNIEESLKAVTAEFKAEELIKRRPQVKAAFDELLAERLSVFRIDVIAVSLTDFQFSSAFSDAIESKVSAEQRALEAKNKLEQIRYEAQQQVIQAEAEKNATIARAEGEAQAAIIAANATARSIEVITSQMTPEYAQYLWLTQWDGKLPAVVGDSQGIILDLTSLAKEGG
jgi:regulator of protease activity HflC (stomatin/prohibitin superfamily)